MGRDRRSTDHARLIETDRFPIAFVSSLAEHESWRKEVFRPIYHVHKWWAKRLGSVFRSAILGCLLPEDGDLETEFHATRRPGDVVVLDPFMGSGTTVGEAHKLGCIALGRDINPVACESVRVALGSLDRRKLHDSFQELSATVGRRIMDLYRTTDGAGNPGHVLYYFWAMAVECLRCRRPVELFSTRIIARNAYVAKRPEVRVCCPRCGDVFSALHSDRSVECAACGHRFDPHAGSASGAKATCSACGDTFAVVSALRATGSPPGYRLIAKLVLADDGRKRYARPDDGDLQAFQEAARVLESEVSEGRIRLPVAVLEPGHNTRQAMAYNFLTWRSFFNERQLLALGWLQKAIAILPDERVRAALLLVFSGALEFNNMFASYKGEGTGAVRHMFSHHVLKPERMPIEANVWGTHKSSGSFSGLYRARLLRALDYAEAPSEVGGRVGTKARVCSPPFSGRVDLAWPSAGALERRGIYLSCASSDSLDLPDRSADYVVTDPPFFDNVHYSELADFFFAWQSLYPRGFIQRGPSTRDVREVQDADPGAFAAKLQSVFAECRRVLKDDGLLVFSYHHSRAEGWTTLAGAVAVAGFSFVSAHPVRSEMTVAAPKSQAKEPIQLDVLFACRKRDRDRRRPAPPETALHLAEQRSVEKVALLRSAGLSLSPGDLRVVLLSQFLVALCPRDAHEIVSALMAFLPDLDAVIARVAECPREAAARSPSPDGQALLPLDTHGSHRSRAGKGAEGRAGTGKRAARFGS